MNRLEFKETIKTMDIFNPLSTTTGKDGSVEDVHYWNNLALWFSGDYYAIIHGKIPLEVANNIYEKYPSNPYNIRVSGGSADWIPSEHATDDKYEKEIQEYIDKNYSMDEYFAKRKIANRNLKRRSDKNKYITVYHIDTKEGLLIFLTEMKDYYLRKKGRPETEVNNYDDLLLYTNKEIIKKVNPGIDAYTWMDNNDKYKDIIEKDNNDELKLLLRNKLDEFDKSVNPFISNIDIDDLDKYLECVNISANTYDIEKDNYRKGCCNMTITNNDTKDSTLYFRYYDGFSFQMKYKLDDKNYLYMSHNYVDDNESVLVNYWGEGFAIDIDYNITNGTIGERYKNKGIATNKHIEMICDELDKAISYASSITLDKYIENKNSKKLKINNFNRIEENI